MSEDWEGAQTGVMSARVKNEIVKTALSHHLLSQFTSFVAVDKAEVTKGNNLALVDVLVNAAQGVENTQPPAPTPAPPAVSPGSGITYGCSNYDPNAPANPVVNKVIGRAFAQVTQRLNSLSCASCSASVPLAGMPTTTTIPETGAYNPYIYGNPNNAQGLANPQLDSNFGDWLLLPWSFFGAPFRAAVIILLVAIAAYKSQRISKQVRSLEELNQSEITWTVLLFSIAIALTIGHVNILNFPAS